MLWDMQVKKVKRAKLPCDSASVAVLRVPAMCVEEKMKW